MNLLIQILFALVGSIFIAILIVVTVQVVYILHKKYKSSNIKLPWKGKRIDDVLWCKNALDAGIIADKLALVEFDKDMYMPRSKYKVHKEYGTQGIINILNEYKCPNFNYRHVYLIEYLLKDKTLSNKDRRLYWLSYALLQDDNSEYNDRFSSFKTTSHFFSKYSKNNLSTYTNNLIEKKRLEKLQNDVITISKVMNNAPHSKPDAVSSKIESVSLTILKFNPNGDINELNSLNNSVLEILQLYNKMTKLQKNVFMDSILNQLDTIDASVCKIVNSLQIEGSDAHFEHHLKINERYLSNFK